jgi:hypothetical protein
MSRMETLGLSESTPRIEGRLKSLFWPSIQNGADVDYLGVQGYWVCAIVGLLSLLVYLASGYLLLAGLAALFFYLSGVGVRERSRYAAAAVFSAYALDTIAAFCRLYAGTNTQEMAAAPSVVRVILTALLLSNLRATWIAARWKPDSEESVLPARMQDTWADKFADWLPMQLWPKVRIVYYVISGVFLFLCLLGVLVVLIRILR